jgi:tetratricopeptide (TPR) repeat protein
MGVVYQAEQLEPLRRTVALKVIRGGMDTREVLARFESERQALGVMDHPNIAKALDAGTTDDGLPFFVMELVAGVPIADYCDMEQLDVRQRLDLFAGVCKGVQHAHQKGVIHRDLKPSNILVRVIDERPVATIIDFGIAKAVERRADSTFATDIGVMVGTPAYMSPEQAGADGLDIDTRSDIYSLGVVLYELCTGSLPVDVPGRMNPAYIPYALATADVPTPSRRVGSLPGNTVNPVAQQRHTTPAGLRRELKGDVDWIVLKAIDRERSRRYETANAMALDIERHLANKPVAARPPTLTYTASKFVRRHRVMVAVAATAATGLAVLVVGIARERNRAEHEGAKAQTISTFLEDMLKSADPWEGGARQTTVVDALRAGVGRLRAGGIADPIVASSIKRTIGVVYLRLGRLPDADTLLHEALAERMSRTGLTSLETAQSLSDLGVLYEAQGRLDSSEVALGRALKVRRRLLGARDTLVAATLLELADLSRLRGETRRQDSLATAALEILRGVYGKRHRSLVGAMQQLTSARLTAGKYPAADSIARAAIAMLRDLGLGRSAEVIAITNDLALSRSYQGDHVEARALMHQVVTLDSTLLGSSHPDLAAHLENLGLVYNRSGFPDSNAAVLRQTLSIRQTMLADDNPDIGRTLFNLGTAEYARGAYARAEPLYEEALSRMRRAYGPEHTDVVYATGALGRNQYYLGHRAEAERNLRWALAVKNPDGRLPPEDVATLGRAMVLLLMDERRWTEAEPLALRILAIHDSLADTLSRESAAQLAKLYAGWGKPERAAVFRKRASLVP